MAKKRINVSLDVEVLKKLDAMAASFKMDRSAMITNFVMMVDAMDQNKQMVALMSKMIRDALK